MSRFLKFAIPVLALGMLGTAYASDSHAQAAEHGSATLITPSATPLFMLPIAAAEEGFFADHGVDVTVQYLQPGVGSTALAGGQVQFAMASGNVGHALAVQGANVIEVATITDKPMMSIIASADVASFEDLAGKTVAYSVPTAAPTVIFRALLRDNGIDPDRDVQGRVIAATADQVSGLNSGAVSAMMATKPLDLIAETQGARILLDVSRSEMLWPYASVIVNGDYAAQNPEAVVAVLRGLLDARTWWIENPEDAKALIAREMNVDNQEIIDGSYSEAAEAFRAEPFPSVELTQSVLDELVDLDGFAGAADVDPARLIDASFLERALQ